LDQWQLQSQAWQFSPHPDFDGIPRTCWLFLILSGIPRIGGSGAIMYLFGGPGQSFDE
jgi:hypothetical protein